MTREETQKLLFTISSIYPNFKPEDKTLAIDSWQWALADYPAESVMAALQIYIKTNNSGFAPSVSQLIGAIHAPHQNDQMSEGEAWALVKMAIADSGYNSVERFEKLPPLIQRAVGRPAILKEWALCDSDEVNTVIMSNFQRTYRALLSKQEFNEKVPPQLAQIVNGLVEKVSGERLIGAKDV